MYKSVLYDKNNIKLKRLLIGKKIKKIDYSENIPLEDNCIKIIFEDNSYVLFYSILRIIKNAEIVLSSTDYYFDINFNENCDKKTKDEKLIFKALKYVNKQLKEKNVIDVIFNNYGDIVLIIEPNTRIESFYDISENEKDYYTYFDNKGNCFSLYRMDNQLFVIEDANDKI